ncbi:hypothetical protein EW145_g5644 [Phellinidium pouzarii]|uniref:glutathione transferase n=1 Tax=Phellinidium pouzarii TaxID=167371 RepID=A0A4S4L0L1_9AGAM|nr:hypothetical protein EW145_g5644 [Phellinidium pouzarii]
MVLKIHGFVFSTCTQAVITTLKELGVAYELVPINLGKGAHKNPDYIATKQPFGQIPVLEEEDGFQLYESRAIARYVIAKYGPNSGLIPSGDLRKIALFEQAVSVENNNFYPYASGLAQEKIFKPAKGAPSSEERATENFKALEEKLEVYDVILGKQKYIAGDEFTLADILHLPYGTLITAQLGFKALEGPDAKPNVARWWADITSRASWKYTQADIAAAAGMQVSNA